MPGHLQALLGPTNTGKTHYAMERLLSHAGGIIGFPLRLLARENYDRAVTARGAGAVALITGEEKISPPYARYFICTVEAMPLDRAYDFLAVDEIQLAADPERGHVFTDRILHARGTKETLFLGADTMQPVLKHLFPDIDIKTSPRLSQLTYAGSKKMTRLPPRSVVVAFGVNDLYALAETVRQHRGGAAIVLGALSPRTRNAQVGLFQSGEVDIMVATDAIGMGLNMDIHHVAFASMQKFDGQRQRRLTAAETGQIAGRAGRGQRDGTFGVTGSLPELKEELVEAVETHTFPRVEGICWRASDLDFRSPGLLLKSLEAPAPDRAFVRGRPADDYTTLTALARQPLVESRAGTPDRVRLLWDVCQIPDFRKTLTTSHEDMALHVFDYLTRGVDGAGRLPEDWVRDQIGKIAVYDGDIDTLMTRISYIRTWTYIAHRPGWLLHPEEWQAKARDIEDRLSDALHAALMSRFVDSRASALIRFRDLPEGAVKGGVSDTGRVSIESIPVGQMQGFSFIPDAVIRADDRALVKRAARKLTGTYISQTLMSFLQSQPAQFRLLDDGSITWQPDATNPLPGVPVARVVRGDTILTPRVEMLAADLAGDAPMDAAAAFLQEWLTNHLAVLLKPLFDLRDMAETVPAPVRGIGFQVFENFGICPRAQVADLIAGLDPEGRKILRDKGVRLGPVLVFVPALNKPALVRLRGLLWALYGGTALPAPVPRDGSVSVAVDAASADRAFYQAIGYPVYGPRAARIDMLDRVISAVYDGAKDGRFRPTHAMAEWLGCSIPDLYAVLAAMGHKHIPAEEKPAQAAEAVAEAMPAAAPAETTADTPVETAADTPAEAPAPDATVPAAKPETSKPELDLFILKRGKADSAQAPRPPREGRRQQQGASDRGDRAERPERTERTDQPARERKPRPDNHSFAKNKKKPQKFAADFKPRVMSASAPKTDEDNSPFAILKQLKK